MQFGVGPEATECREKHGLTSNILTDVIIKIKAREVLDADLQKKVECAAKCSLEKHGIWKNGGLDTKALEGKTSEFEYFEAISNPKEAIQECAATKGTDDCNIAFKTMLCFREKYIKGLKKA